MNRVEILAVGNELLAGDILDTNFAALAVALRDVGAQVVRHLTLPDDRAEIAAAVDEALGEAELILVTGGLGPTPDDLTRFGVSEALGVALLRDDDTVIRLRERFRQFGIDDMPVMNEVQAMFPPGAAILDNPNGTAAGFMVRLAGLGGSGAPRAILDPGTPPGLDERAVIVMPGPPRELVPMIERHLLPYLRRRGGLPVIAVRRLRTIGIGESLLAERLGDWPAGVDGVELGYYPQDPGVDLKITARGRDAAEADARMSGAVAWLRARLGGHVYGEGRTPLAQVVGERLRGMGRRLALAESCTGGLAASIVTLVPGSSDYFDGGVVSYSNDAKRDWLGVPPEAIDAHGAVSEEVARAMAEGVRVRRGVDYGLGITGVAGPTGGTAEKPVGLVWIALAGPEGTEAIATRHGGDRATVQRRAAMTAIDLLRRRLDRAGAGGS